MDIQALVNAMNKAGREERAGYHITLGQLIKITGGLDDDVLVKFDIGGGPTHPHSYRGYYTDLAFAQGEPVAALGLLLALKEECPDKIFFGYKGGDYVMGENTPLWVAEYGSCGRAIIDFGTEDGALVLKTKEID